MNEDRSWLQWFEAKPLLSRWPLSLLAVAIAATFINFLVLSQQQKGGLEPSFVTSGRNLALYVIAGIAQRAVTYIVTSSWFLSRV